VLPPILTVRLIVRLRLRKAITRQKQAMVENALAQVGLLEKAKHLPNQISGGEKGRVAIARAIVNEPPVLLADEPTGNLDTKISAEIMKLLQNLNGAGMTIVMVAHSTECARYVIRIMRVSDGKLIEDS
jgi:putative ABC transport system ATP-binding protein